MLMWKLRAILCLMGIFHMMSESIVNQYFAKYSKDYVQFLS